MNKDADATDNRGQEDMNMMELESFDNSDPGGKQTNVGSARQQPQITSSNKKKDKEEINQMYQNPFKKENI